VGRGGSVGVLTEREKFRGENCIRRTIPCWASGMLSGRRQLLQVVSVRGELEDVRRRRQMISPRCNSPALQPVYPFTGFELTCFDQCLLAFRHPGRKNQVSKRRGAKCGVTHLPAASKAEHMISSASSQESA